MSNRRCVWVVGIALLAAMQLETQGAQPRGPAGPGNLPELSAQGTIDGFHSGMLWVKGANEKWAFQVPRDAKVEIKGKVKPEFLTPGHCVQFTATVDMKSGKVEEKGQPGQGAEFVISLPKTA